MDASAILKLEIENFFTDLTVDQIIKNQNEISLSEDNHSLLDLENSITILKNELAELKKHQSNANSSFENLLVDLRDKNTIIKDVENRINNLKNQIELERADLIIGTAVTSTESLQREILNTYKLLLKVKWFYDESQNIVEGLIFNERTARCREITVTKNNNTYTSDVWNIVEECCME